MEGKSSDWEGQGVGVGVDGGVGGGGGGGGKQGFEERAVEGEEGEVGGQVEPLDGDQPHVWRAGTELRLRS